MSLVTGLGILEFLCAVVYAIPQTSVLGAILMTGYLGGAALTNLRVGGSWIVPILLGLFAWTGLWSRDTRVRELIFIRR